MKVTSVQVHAVNAPMPQPHRTASGTITVSPLVLVELRTDQGITGNGLLFTYTPVAQKPVATLLQNLAPLLEGQPVAPATVSDALHARFRLLGTQGLLGMALAGIDMALWDALARAAGQPLHAVLGAQARPLPAYAGIGFDGVDGCARAAGEFARQGFRAMKAKIGYPTVEEDLAVIRAMREAAGPGVTLMVDYNQSLPAAEAARRLQLLDGEGLGWIEEPVLAHDFASLARLGARLRTPLQAGENWWGPQDFQHAFDAGVRGIAMPDVMKAGGVTGWQRVAGLGAGLGVSLSSHLWPEISAQLLCATPTAHWLEYADWWNAVLAEPLEVREGMAQPSLRPGSGIDFDADAIRRFSA